MVDVTTWRAYSAEHSLPPQRPLPDMPAVDRFVRQVVSSALWQELVPYAHEVRVTEAPFKAHESWLERDRAFEYRSATLAVHPDMRWTLNLLHELSHGASPKYRYVPDSTGHEWPPHLELHPHGGLWASTYLRLVRDFAPDWHDGLRDAYEHYQVELVDDDTLLAAIRESRRAERELAEWDAGVTGDVRAWSHLAIRLQQHDPGRNLQPSLASLILAGAYRAADEDLSVNRIFDPIVAMISCAVPCSAEDLRTISEHDTVASLHAAVPGNEATRLARIALAALIALDVDPLFIRTEIGLTRWDVGLDEDQVARLNPDWWTRVQFLNRLTSERPSRWEPTTLNIK